MTTVPSGFTRVIASNRVPSLGSKVHRYQPYVEALHRKGLQDSLTSIAAPVGVDGNQFQPIPVYANQGAGWNLVELKGKDYFVQKSKLTGDVWYRAEDVLAAVNKAGGKYILTSAERDQVRYASGISAIFAQYIDQAARQNQNREPDITDSKKVASLETRRPLFQLNTSVVHGEVVSDRGNLYVRVEDGIRINPGWYNLGSARAVEARSRTE